MHICQKKSKKIFYNFVTFLFTIIFLALLLFSENTTKAQGENFSGPQNEGNITVDSDLDGLTDMGETQTYKTDPFNPDTDSDGFYDGSEVLAQTDPLSPKSPSPLSVAENAKKKIFEETPWPWYISRASGLTAFLLLWLTVFWGLYNRNPVFKKFIKPNHNHDIHCLLSALTVFWSLAHATSLFFDKFFGAGLKDIFIPFYLKSALVNTNYLALGIMAFYAMFILVITSYLRKHLNRLLWRITHFLNPIIFIFVVFHGFFLGTDTKNIYIKWIFISSSLVIVLFYLLSLIFLVFKKRKNETETSSGNYTRVS